MIWEAREALRGVARVTPLNPAKNLGKNVYIKSENLQLTGAFKVRGAYNKLRSLSEEERAKGVIACSAGNHAQGGGFAAAGRSQQGKEFTFPDIQGDTVQGGKIAVTLHSILDNDFVAHKDRPLFNIKSANSVRFKQRVSENHLLQLYKGGKGSPQGDSLPKISD